MASIKLQIYSTDGTLRYEASAYDGSKRVYSLMGDDYATLKFSVEQPIAFALGDYVDIPLDFEDEGQGFERFELTEMYAPKYNTTTGGYDYELKMEAEHMKWRNKIFKYMPNSAGQEASWSLTDTLERHLTVFMGNLTALGYKFRRTTDYAYSIATDVTTASKLITYSNASLLDALNAMAETFDCEWWLTENTIHLGKCELSGDAVDFEIGVNLYNMEASTSKNTYATRLYVFGSERNLPSNYRDTDPDIVKNGVVQRRLMLPEGTPYIDAETGQTTENAVEEVVIFEDVYPKMKNKITEVTTYQTEDEDEDGNKLGTYTTFYRFKADLTFSKDYMMTSSSDPLSIVFQDGALQGMDFEVNFNPDGKPEHLSDSSWNPEAQVFEIVMNDDYGRSLPAGTLIPAVGNVFVLYGWDTTKWKTPYKETSLMTGSASSSIGCSETTSESGTVSCMFYFFYFGDLTYTEEDIPDGAELRVRFTSGPYSGKDFAVTYSPYSGNHRYIIIPNENYGTMLPSKDTLTTEMPGFEIYALTYTSQMVLDAEQELLKEGEAYMEKSKIDPNTYKCTLMCDYAYGLGPLGNQDSDYKKRFERGQKVNLINHAYFASGSRQSRIIGYEYDLAVPYNNPKYTVGEAAAYSRLDDLESTLESVTLNGSSYSSSGRGSGGASVYVIGTSDRTMATDTNVYSARRSNAQFLRKDIADTASGLITFLQGLLSEGDARFNGFVQNNGWTYFGQFVQSLYAGMGAGIDAQGNAEVESLKVRSYMEVLELIVNRLSAIEGDQLLTESDTIESVVDLGNGVYGLYLREKWDGYFTAQAEYNVIKGIINTLAEGSGDYYTSWMRVNTVDTANNYIEVILYPDDEVPAGKNFPPIETMRIARWGNQVDTARQDCLYLSSTERCIRILKGVTKPILDDANYGASFGALPDFVNTLTDSQGNPLPIREGLDYMYIPGIIAMDVIRLNKWTLKPIVTYVDRGQWTEGGLYYCEAQNPETGEYETSDVWYMGCKWRCCKNLTESVPAFNNTDWAMIEGDPTFKVDFVEQEQLFDPSNFVCALTIVAVLYNQDVTEHLADTDVVWTRYTQDSSGAQRTASDEIWNARRGGSGKAIILTWSDLDYESYMPPVIKFTATVTLRTSSGEVVGTDSVTMSIG